MDYRNPLITKWERLFTFLSIIMFSGGILPLFRSPENGNLSLNATDGDIVFQIIWILIYTITVVLIIFKTTGIRNVSNHPLLLLLLLLALLSILWSDFPLITLRRVAAVLLTTLFGFYLSNRYSLIQILELLHRAFLLLSILSIIVVAVLPSYGIMHDRSEELNGTWRGIFAHKNTLGRVMVLNAVISFTLWHIQRKNKYIFSFLIAFVLIYFTGSATALLNLVFIIALDYILRIFKKISLSGFLAALMLFFAVLVFLNNYLTNNYAELFFVLGKDPTLTGRTVLWDQLFSMIGQKPFLGYGFGAFWLNNMGPSARIWNLFVWEPKHAHNGYIDLILELGYIGLVVYCFLFFSNYLSFLKKFSKHNLLVYRWGVLYLTFLLTYNFSESNILKANSIYWILLISSISIYKKPNLNNQHILRH